MPLDTQYADRKAMKDGTKFDPFSAGLVSWTQRLMMSLIGKLKHVSILFRSVTNTWSF